MRRTARPDLTPPSPPLSLPTIDLPPARRPSHQPCTRPLRRPPAGTVLCLVRRVRRLAPRRGGGEGGDDPSCNKMCVTGTAFTGFTMCVPARLRSYWLCANVQSVSITYPWIPLPPRVELQAHVHIPGRAARRAPRGGGAPAAHTRHAGHTLSLITVHTPHTTANGARRRGSRPRSTPPAGFV